MQLPSEAELPRSECKETHTNRSDEDWLQQNADLRVDPNVASFSNSRARFACERYRFALTLCHGKRVLDAACGTGFGSAILSEAAKSVVGIDNSSEAVDYAMRKFGTDRVTFRRSCVESTPFEADSFEIIASFETLEHLVAPRACLAEFARLITNDGTAIFSIPNGWGLTAHHFFDLNASSLRELTSDYFDDCEFHYHNSGERADKTLVGIGKLEGISTERAECVLAVCRRPRKEKVPQNAVASLLDEVYENAFQRHREYLHFRERSIVPFPVNAGQSGSATTVRAGETLTLHANDFGSSSGNVQMQVAVEILTWHPQHVTLRLPNIAGRTGSDAQLNVVLADGRVAASPSLRIVPDGK